MIVAAEVKFARFGKLRQFPKYLQELHPVDKHTALETDLAESCGVTWQLRMGFLAVV